MATFHNHGIGNHNFQSLLYSFLNLTYMLKTPIIYSVSYGIEALNEEELLKS